MTYLIFGESGVSVGSHHILNHVGVSIELVCLEHPDVVGLRLEILTINGWNLNLIGQSLIHYFET